MHWPTPQDYNEAIQNPRANFSEEPLKSGSVALNSLGLPKSITGAFASVYKVSTQQRDYAVRCFLSHADRKRHNRYHDLLLMSFARNTAKEQYGKIIEQLLSKNYSDDAASGE